MAALYAATHPERTRALILLNTFAAIARPHSDAALPSADYKQLVAWVEQATLLPLEGAGHGVDQADWPTVVPAILKHTRSTRSG